MAPIKVKLVVRKETPRSTIELIVREMAPELPQVLTRATQRKLMIHEYIGEKTPPMQVWTNEQMMEWVTMPNAENTTPEDLEIAPTRKYRVRFCAAVCVSKMDKERTKIVKKKEALPRRWIRVPINDCILPEEPEQMHKPRLFPNHTTIPYHKWPRVWQHAIKPQSIKIRYSLTQGRFLPAEIKTC